VTREEYLELGLAYLKKKEWKAALSALQESRKRHEAASDILPPSLLSALGICLAMAEDKVETGIELCQAAIDAAFFHPEFYYHLGMVYLKAGKKHEAIRSFYKGLKLEPKHDDILGKLRQMGIRKKRSFPFLPRQNFVNRFFGKWVA